MHRGREGVVRALPHVAVIVGMHRVFGAYLAAEDFDRAVGDHLVGVHVRLGAAACLPNHQREVVVELAFDHFACGGDDGIGQLRVKRAAFLVGLRAGFLDHAERSHDGDGLGFPADREIHDRALRLCAPVLVGGNLERAEAVGFSAGGGHGWISLEKKAVSLIADGAERSMMYAMEYRPQAGDLLGRRKGQFYLRKLSRLTTSASPFVECVSGSLSSSSGASSASESSSSASSCESKRRPNSTEGSTKVLIAS